jgi:hypothetical protein
VEYIAVSGTLSSQEIRKPPELLPNLRRQSSISTGGSPCVRLRGTSAYQLVETVVS